MSEVEVGLGSILRHIAFSMLVRVESSRVDVDVRVKFLDGDTQSPGLQQFGERCGNYAFAKRRSDASCYKYIFRVHFCIVLTGLQS